VNAEFERNANEVVSTKDMAHSICVRTSTPITASQTSTTSFKFPSDCDCDLDSHLAPFPRLARRRKQPVNEAKCITQSRHRQETAPRPAVSSWRAACLLLGPHAVDRLAGAWSLNYQGTCGGKRGNWGKARICGGAGGRRRDTGGYRIWIFTSNWRCR
jgi:hypothetical protein